MQKFDWEAGKKFGRLMLTGKSYVNGKHRYVETICDCDDKIKWIRFDGIKSGLVVSCGCYQKEISSEQLTTHGLSGHPLYHTHEDMKARCYNTQCEAYLNYGARGIIVCEEWHEFKHFYEWAINNGWFEGCNLTLDRRDNDGNYEPSNCRFSTNHIQSRNKRTTKWLIIFGERKCQVDWASDIRCVVDLGTFSTRIRRGWDVEKALTTHSKIPENRNKRTVITIAR